MGTACRDHLIRAFFINFSTRAAEAFFAWSGKQYYRNEANHPNQLQAL